MYRALSALVPRDRDLPERAWRLQVLQQFLDGTIYDLQQYEFHQERDGLGNYIPVVQRAPSVRFGLLKTVVNDSGSFLFSDVRFPNVSCERGHEKAQASLQWIVRDCRLGAVMLDAATRGSVGSVVVWVRVFGSRLFFEALDTAFLTPTFKADAPDTLEKVTERYKVKGKILAALGYAIDEDDMAADFWFQREWSDSAETWFLPQLVSKSKDGNGKPIPMQVDTAKTVNHKLGFVPMVWVLNLPGGDKVDGACTFAGAIDTSIEIDYQLSQAGRGLKYSSSPTLVIKEGESALSTDRQQHIVGDALIIPNEGNASLLEITGDATSAVVEYVREIRKLALETVGGSRADSDKLSAATSGRAMELMNQALVNLADRLRSSYGEGGLLQVLKMAAKISRQFALVDSDGVRIDPIPAGTRITLQWAAFYALTADDRQADAIAITTLTGGRPVMSQRTGISAIASEYAINDQDSELTAVKAEAAEALDAQATRLQPPWQEIQQ